MRADGLNGTTVTGVLVSAVSNVSVTTQFTSPLVVGSSTGFVGTLYTANFNEELNVGASFTKDGLVVDMIGGPGDYVNLTEKDGDLFTLIFTDPAFANMQFIPTHYGCDSTTNDVCTFYLPDNGLTGNSVSGDTLTLSFKNNFAGQQYTFNAAAAAAQTPEPSSLALLGSGLVGVVGLLRRRFA